MKDENRSMLLPFRTVCVATLCSLAGTFLLGCADDSLPLGVQSTAESVTIASDQTDPPATDAPETGAPAVSSTPAETAISTTPAETAISTTPAETAISTTAVPVTPAGDADPNGVDPPSQDLPPNDTVGVLAEQASYPTLEDGTPVPIVAIFDGDTIALSGVAPSQAASDRLATLAIANSAVPNAGVVNFLTINPDVPIGVGVRVIEMQSVRFGESSAEIVPEHAAQLDRAVAVMTALPNISVVVIGHADQRGDPARNYEISAERAQSVVDYMAAQGIEPSRLASRAVGASDLLTLNNDDIAFELNRRTEFIFYGLLVE